MSKLTNTQEHDMKIKLVKAIRMMENIQLLDMNGHISYRIPETERILINARKASRASISVRDITVVDLEGNLLESELEPPSEVHIHTAIYRKRQDVHAVVHNHPHWQTVLGIAGHKMTPVFSVGSFVKEFPTYEASSLINTREMGEELANVLGSANTVQIRHHGSVAVAENVLNVFARAVYMEENARKQYDAALLGAYHTLTGENLQRTRSTNWNPNIVEKVWNYYEEKANRQSLFEGI